MKSPGVAPLVCCAVVIAFAISGLRYASSLAWGRRGQVESGGATVYSPVSFDEGSIGVASAITPTIHLPIVMVAPRGLTTRVSVASNGTQGNHFSFDPSISADGRYVAFDSFASNLVSGDTNGYQDVFVRDRQTGRTRRVSVATNRTQGNGDSSYPSISADGRYVAFASEAGNLVDGDTNGYEDVFVRDRVGR